MMEEKTYLLPDELRQALLNYLGSRPFTEVREGIQALEACKEAKSPSTGE